MAKPVVLVIRDGWGDNPGGESTKEKDGNAVLQAKTPFHEELFAEYPYSHVATSGLEVGLPEGQMGNSEVGHMNLGAGRIVYQDLTRINKTIEEGKLSDNAVLRDAFSRARQGRRLHFIGLLSDGGVHSHQDQLAALAGAAYEAGCRDLFVHAITDGRDTSPTGGAGYLSECEDRLAPFGARIITVVGRYYAMDRDKRWDRTKLAWDAIVHGKGECMDVLPSEAVRERYREDKTDEFLLPILFREAGSCEVGSDSPAGGQRIEDDDVVIVFNFRADRARQLSNAFLDEGFDGFDREGWPRVHYVTLTEYDETYDCPVVFPPETMSDVLGEVVARAGLKQLRIAETEKYPHVTYFFNGGLEEPFEGEDREIVPSPKVATYDLQPEMSAPEVTQKVVERLRKYDLVILNYANPDMVGHTGDVKAAIVAVETVDAGLKAVVDETMRLGGSLLITADHGNCEYMRNPDGSPHTAHTTFPVHLFYVGADAAEVGLQDGVLADIAPTLLDMLGLEKPEAMAGSSLLVRKGAAVG